MVEFLRLYPFTLLPLLNDLCDRLGPQVEHLIPPILLHHFRHVKIFKSFLGDGLSQMLLQVLIVDNATYPLGVRVVGSTCLAESKIWILFYVFWNIYVVAKLIMPRRLFISQLLLSLAHHIKIMQVSLIQVLLYPIFGSISLGILPVLLTVVKWVQLPPLLLAQLAEITE